MTLPSSEAPEAIPPKKAGTPDGIDHKDVKTAPPLNDTPAASTTLSLSTLPDWSTYFKGTKAFDPTLTVNDKAITWGEIANGGAADDPMAAYKTKIQGANDFVGQITGKADSQDGALDWLFDSGTGPKAAGSDVKATKTAPDGTVVAVAASKTKISADAGSAHIDHSVKDGTNIYRSDDYVATDSKGLKTITDVKSGYTVQWDSTTHKGELLDKDHKIKMTFNSEDQFNAKVQHMLTRDRSLSQFTNKTAMDTSVQNYMEARKKGTASAQGEHIFVDANGDYSIIAKDGVLYEYDRTADKVYATRDGKRVEVKRGSTYQDVSGNTTVNATGKIALGPTKLDTAACSVDAACTLTTQSDTGPVTVTAGAGESKVTNPQVAAVTLKDTGAIDNTDPASKAVFAHADTKGNVSGNADNGASYNFDNSGWVVNEPNGQYTCGKDNGSIASYSPDGTELFDINANGDVDVMHSPLYYNSLTDNDDDDSQTGGDGGAAVADSPAATTAISTFAAAGVDVSMSDGALDPAKAGDLSSRLMNDYAQLNDFAAAASAKGLIWAANILQDRAASVLAAAGKIQEKEAKGNNERQAAIEPAVTRPRADFDGGIVTGSETVGRRESDGLLGTRTASLTPAPQNDEPGLP